MDSLSVLVAAHASLDEYVATWFGLDQSKYQWALNDYYERTGQVIQHFSFLFFCLLLVILTLVSCSSVCSWPFLFVLIGSVSLIPISRHELGAN